MCCSRTLDGTDGSREMNGNTWISGGVQKSFKVDYPSAPPPTHLKSRFWHTEPQQKEVLDFPEEAYDEGIEVHAQQPVGLPNEQRILQLCLDRGLDARSPRLDVLVFEVGQLSDEQGVRLGQLSCFLRGQYL